MSTIVCSSAQTCAEVCAALVMRGVTFAAVERLDGSGSWVIELTGGY